MLNNLTNVRNTVQKIVTGMDYNLLNNIYIIMQYTNCIQIQFNGLQKKYDEEAKLEKFIAEKFNL